MRSYDCIALLRMLEDMVRTADALRLPALIFQTPLDVTAIGQHPG